MFEGLNLVRYLDVLLTEPTFIICLQAAYMQTDIHRMVNVYPKIELNNYGIFGASTLDFLFHCSQGKTFPEPNVAAENINGWKDEFPFGV